MRNQVIAHDALDFAALGIEKLWADAASGAPQSANASRAGQDDGVKALANPCAAEASGRFRKSL
jgi:hypothetical protein